MLNLNSLAASPCVISFFLVFFNATSRSLSTWVISSCPSCIPKAWGCQDDISTLLKHDILTLLPHLVVSRGCLSSVHGLHSSGIDDSRTGAAMRRDFRYPIEPPFYPAGNGVSH